MSFKMVTVAPENVMKNWQFFHEGCMSVMENSTKDLTLDQILNNLMAGRWVLIVGFEDGKYQGYAIVYKETNIYNESGMFVVQSYIKADAPAGFFDKANDFLIAMAKEKGMSYLKFWTTRDKAFEKKLKQKGYEKGYSEFTNKFTQEKEHDGNE